MKPHRPIPLPKTKSSHVPYNQGYIQSLSPTTIYIYSTATSFQTGAVKKQKPVTLSPTTIDIYTTATLFSTEATKKN
jgi:hypothetical protein